jgi:hypothetical protein
MGVQTTAATETAWALLACCRELALAANSARFLKSWRIFAHLSAGRQRRKGARREEAGRGGRPLARTGDGDADLGGKKA